MRTQLQSPFNAQHSTVNMQGTCMNWRSRLWMWRTRATKTSFSHIKLSYAMLHSLSRRIYILLPYLIRATIIITLIIPFTRAPQAEGQPPATTSPRPEPKGSPWPKRQHSSTEAQGHMSIDENSPMASQEGLSSSKRGKTADWSSSLKPSHVDAFSQDSSPVKEARVCYFATHPWDWANGNTDDLSDIFRELSQGAGLLGESIHEIKLSWDGPEELKHANYVLWSLPKGLKFLRVVSPKESPKVMGLKGIHDPNALQHFANYTYCPWCRKDGQNEGTIINHLRTVHYRLGLLCDQCYCCPTVTLDTLCQHGSPTCSD